MKTRKRLIKITLLVAVLTLLLAGLACLPQMQSYAGGTVTVNVGNQDSWPSGTEFTFELYKVGEYGHDADGMSVFNLDDKYAEAGVSQKLATASSYDQGTTSDKDWSQNWLDTANTLATYINSMTSGKPEAQTATATFGNDGKASFSITVNKGNGLYLLVGKSKEIGGKLWTPQPMFVSVLDDNKTITFDNSLGVKMISRDIVFDHNVVKMWEGDGDVSDYVRPDKVAVKIMYGSTLVDTVILDKKNGYSFSWKHKAHYSSGADAAASTDDEIVSIGYIKINEDGSEAQEVKITPAAGDAGWSVVEIRDESQITDADAKKQAPMLRSYNTTYLPQQVTDETETFTITNKYVCKMLKLKKTIDGYVDDGQNVAFSFKIVGKDSNNKEIYTNHIGISFEKNEGVTKEAVLNNIPVAVETIEVTEEYSGNYVQDGPIKITEITKTDSDGGTAYVVGWQAEANNKHNGHGPGGGVVNKYEHGQSPVQDGGSEPAAEDND